MCDSGEVGKNLFFVIIFYFLLSSQYFWGGYTCVDKIEENFWVTKKYSTVFKGICSINWHRLYFTRLSAFENGTGIEKLHVLQVGPLEGVVCKCSLK